MKKLIYIALILSFPVGVMGYLFFAEGDYVTKWSLHAGNGNSFGITTDGTNIWINDLNSDEVFKYEMDGTYVTKWSLHVNNGYSNGITTDGTNIWVNDLNSDEVFKYEMVGTYVTKWSLHADNGNSRGITTDGTNIWVNDSISDEVFKYEGVPVIGDTKTRALGSVLYRGRGQELAADRNEGKVINAVTKKKKG